MPAQLPMRPALTVLGGLVLLFSCFIAFLAQYTKPEYTGQVVDSEWERSVVETRCDQQHMVSNGWIEYSVRGCRLVDHGKASGRHGEPPRWPVLWSVASEDSLRRQEKYTLRIEYEDGGKKVVTYHLLSEEEYRLFSKPGQQVSFTLKWGRVSGLRQK